MLFSVIVPVYNVEKYLNECLKSLEGQTFKDFELILVDDGSTDNSGEICDYYAGKDPKIRVIHNENMGVSLARNAGLAVAKGEYVCFVDSDDYLEADYLENFARAINEHHPDLVCCNCYMGSDVHKYPYFEDKHFSKDEIREKIYPFVISNARYEYFPPTFWGKAFKKELFAKNICKYKIKIGEDTATIPPIVIKCSSMYLISKPLYHYRILEDSAINRKKPRDYNDVINVHAHYQDILKDQYDEFSLQIDRLIAHLAFNCSITQFYCGKPYKEIKKIIIGGLAIPVIDEAIKHIDAKGFKGSMMRFSLKHRNIFLMRLYSKIM